jgi:hypothetical protein
MGAIASEVHLPFSTRPPRDVFLGDTSVDFNIGPLDNRTYVLL